MVASIATVGASAALVAGASTADAQGVAAMSAGPDAGTVYVGEIRVKEPSGSTPEIKAMLDLYPGRQILDMPKQTYPTTLHNALINVGITAFEPEIGAARILNPEMIELFVEGTMNVLKHHGIIAGPMGRTGKDVTVFIGNSGFPILANRGGLVEHLVKLNDKVVAGQKIAIQRATSSAKWSRSI